MSPRSASSALESGEGEIARLELTFEDLDSVHSQPDQGLSNSPTAMVPVRNEMMANGQSPIQSDFSSRHGLTGFHAENLLQESVSIAATMTGSPAALILNGETSTRHSYGSGLTWEQLSEIEQVLAQHPYNGSKVQQLSKMDYKSLRLCRWKMRTIVS